MATAFANTSANTTVSTPTWTFDPVHSAVEFSAKHMMITTVKGRFNELDVNLNLDDKNLTNSSVEVAIGAASLTTNEPNRDNHLRSADFLDVENHPTITFKSKRIVHVDGNDYRIVGDLTIRGVTREVTLDTTLEGRGTNPYGRTIIAFSAKTAINRKDFGLQWNVALETGGVLVGDTVKIGIELQAYQQ